MSYYYGCNNYGVDVSEMDDMQRPASDYGAETGHPYVVGYAKSGRSKCKGCNFYIEMDKLRLGVYFVSPSQVRMQSWYHPSCFFERHSPAHTQEIDDFSRLSMQHQQDILQLMQRGPQSFGHCPGGNSVGYQTSFRYEETNIREHHSTGARRRNMCANERPSSYNFSRSEQFTQRVEERNVPPSAIQADFNDDTLVTKQIAKRARGNTRAKRGTTLTKKNQATELDIQVGDIGIKVSMAEASVTKKRGRK